MTRKLLAFGILFEWDICVSFYIEYLSVSTHNESSHDEKMRWPLSLHRVPGDWCGAREEGSL